MTKKKSTKRALLMSALSLLLCVSMLIGSTYAWFTDSVTSATNKIVAGNLDVDLLMGTAADTYTSIADVDAAIFGANSLVAQNDPADTLWEPGKTQIVYLAVENKGNLALKYNIALNVIDGGLIGSLEYAIVDGAKFGTINATSWEEVKAIPNVQTGDVVAGTTVAAPNGAITAAEKTEYFALAVHMKEEAGNQYRDKDITIDITVLATQLASEKDSFDDQYDKDATYPAVDNLSYPNDNGESVLTTDDAFVALGDNAPAGKYKLVVSDKNVDTDANGETTVSYNIDLYKDGEKVSNNGVEYLVGIKVGTGLKITGLLHKGKAVAAYDYAPTGEYITFKTTSFSPFAVIYTAYSEGSTFASNSADLYTYTLQSGKTGTVVLTDDFKTSDSNKRYYSYMEYLVKGDYALDLNGHTITNDTPYTATDGAGFVYLFTLYNNSKLTVNGEGVINSSFDDGHSAIFWAFKESELTINSGNYNVDDGIVVWAGNGSKVVINGGTYISTNARDDELIYSSGGVIDIYGGFFHNTSGGKTLNVADANRSTGVMTIYGGTYVNFDPSTGGQDPNNIKVADGYKVISETQENGDIWYTVVAE